MWFVDKSGITLAHTSWAYTECSSFVHKTASKYPNTDMNWKNIELRDRALLRTDWPWLEKSHMFQEESGSAWTRLWSLWICCRSCDVISLISHQINKRIPIRQNSCSLVYTLYTNPIPPSGTPWDADGLQRSRVKGSIGAFCTCKRMVGPFRNHSTHSKHEIILVTV